MPIYEYLCEKCGSHIEVIQKISDPPLKRCSKCRGKLGKTVSRTSFQLKGSGWYATDYSNKNSSSSKAPPVNKDKAEKVPDKKAETVSSTAVSSDGD
jgi:putative FmdB family regulatory protein